MSTVTTNFLVSEMERRAAFLTVAIASYDGDPNHVSAPAIIVSAPTGTEYQQVTPSAQLWKKDPAGAWYVLGAVTLDLSAVAQDIIPDADDTRDIGTALLRWAEGYIADVYATLVATATATVSAMLELGSVIRIKATDGAPGALQNGDVWTDAGTFRLRDGGITIRPEVRHPAPVVEAGATRTAVAADHGTTIRFTALATFEVPTGLPAGWWCKVRQSSANQVTIAAGSGATLRALSDYATPLKTAEQYADAVIEYDAADTYKVTGELAQ